MSEAAAPHMLGALVATPSIGRRPRPLAGRRKVKRLRDQIEAQERELLRRQNTFLALARDVAVLRQELASVRLERDRLGADLEHVSALRATEAAYARRLADAVVDQQAAVAELERAVAAVRHAG